MRPARRRVLLRRGVVAVVLVGLISALFVALRQATAPLRPVACEAAAAGDIVSLSPTQMGNAATIAGIAVRRRLPARAATIALATAMQESKLVNVRYGDRDSLGLFQQRPSQGWGTQEQVLDPVRATNAFYDALIEVDDYRSLPVTVAAQRVQRSGYPDAYAEHEADAQVLTAALTGPSKGAITCALDPDRPPSGAAGVPRLGAAVRREQPKTTRVARKGRAGVRLTAPKNRAWTLAHWTVARSDQLGAARVYVDGNVWTRARRDRGWTTSPEAGVPAAGSRDVVVLFTDRAPA